MSTLHTEVLLIAVLFASNILGACTKSRGNETVLNSASGDRVFELRTYTAHEGKLDDLQERFRNHTLRLFEQHGMKNIGYWVPQDEDLANNTLIYIVVHSSREEAEKNWEVFISDPGWMEVYEKSREDGPLVQSIESIFMEATDYSPMKK